MTVVSGPVNLQYPRKADVIPVVSTGEMLAASRDAFRLCDGLIGAAAPCDYGPLRVATHKIAKTGRPLVLNLVEMPDVVATLATEKQSHQWVVGFALETDDPRFRALVKLERKRCDLIVLNGPLAIDSADNEVEILDRQGQVAGTFAGSKEQVACDILKVIEVRLIRPGLSRRPHRTSPASPPSRRRYLARLTATTKVTRRSRSGTTRGSCRFSVGRGMKSTSSPAGRPSSSVPASHATAVHFLEDDLAQPDPRGCHFDQFVVFDVLQRGFERHFPSGLQDDVLVRVSGSDVGELLFLRRIDDQVTRRGCSRRRSSPRRRRRPA